MTTFQSGQLLLDVKKWNGNKNGRIIFTLQPPSGGFRTSCPANVR